MNTNKECKCPVTKLRAFLCSPKLFHYTCIWLIVLVVIGTVAQKQMGLHLAQEKYFSSWILNPFGIPLPGGRLTMCIMFINMVFKTFFNTTWAWKKVGIFITHMGVLLLLGGGFVTAYFSTEGNMVIPEGESSAFYTDSYIRELVLINDKDSSVSLSVHDKDLTTGAVLPTGELPITIQIKHYFENVDIRSLVTERGAPFREIATKVTIAQKAYDPGGRNLAGMIVEVSGLSESANGTYLLFESMLAQQHLIIANQQYSFKLRRKEYSLGFSIELEDFKKEVHPGTPMAKAYSSAVILQDGDIRLSQLISMNEPLRHKGYTFYQSSFIQEGKKETTVLSVVKNYGRTLPYISSIVICIGLMIHMLVMLPQLIAKVRTASAVVLVSFLACTATVQAEVSGDLSSVIIQHQGRLKPLDTYARTLLKTISEKSTYERKPAIQWLTQVLLNPEKSTDQKVFTIRSPEVVKALKVSVDPKSRYSYNELDKGIQSIIPMLQKIQKKEHSTRSRVESQLMGVYGKVRQYEDASHALTALIPDIIIHEKELALKLGLPDNVGLSYLSFVQKRARVGEVIAELQSMGRKIEDYPALSRIIAILNHLAAAPQPLDFRIIPPEGDEPEWAAPWSLLAGHTHVKQKEQLSQFATIIELLSQNKDAQSAIDAYTASVAHRDTVSAELTYNKADFFYYSLLLYIFAFICVALSWVFWAKKLARIALLSTWVGFILHGTGMVYRYIIMGRPPVSNLYESIVFVAFTGVGMCLFMEYRRRDTIGLMGATVSGAVVQFVARKYAVDSDTMGMLVAVLDSNFWLATHVVTITIGYGATMVAAIFGHVYVVKAILKPNDSALLKNLYSNCVGIALVALFFTTLGTILGGIWADQSWGRFWGWDPKENGALLIVLSQILLLHGRFSGHYKPLGFATGLGLCSITVVLAWFGVNLLSVGLHNYGFDDGVARNLYLFCGAEVLFSTVLYFLAKKRLAEAQL